MSLAAENCLRTSRRPPSFSCHHHANDRVATFEAAHAAVLPAPFGLWTDPCAASTGGLKGEKREDSVDAVSWCKLLEHGVPCKQQTAILRQQQMRLEILLHVCLQLD